MEIEGYNMPNDLYCDENHFWIKDDGDLLVMELAPLLYFRGRCLTPAVDGRVIAP